MAERRISTGTLFVLGILLFALVIALGRTLLIRFGNTFQPPAPRTLPATTTAR